MSALTDIQAQFSQLIRSADSDGLSAGQRVYHFAYRQRLLESLAETYAQVWSWLGDAAFEAAAYGYIDYAAPKSWTLDHYGDRFSDYVAGLYPEDPEVGELAALEWALHRAFSGPDAPGLTPEQLAGVDWERVRLRFVPTLTLCPIVSNAPAIWSALKKAETPPAAAGLGSTMTLAVWRKGLEPVFRTLADSESAALYRLKAGARFSEVCAELTDAHGQAVAPETFGGWLTVWIADGLLSELYQ